MKLKKLKRENYMITHRHLNRLLKVSKLFKFIIVSPIYANRTSTIKVSILDVNNNSVPLLATQVIFVQITNEKTKGINFNLIDVAGRKTIIDQIIIIFTLSS